MNTDSHRLIFNTARGCLMAVAETARSVGKGRSSGRKLKTRSCPQSGTNPITSSIYASNRPLAPVAYAQAAINSIAIDRATNDQGSNVQITATGAGADATNINNGNVNIIGSSVSAGTRDGECLIKGCVPAPYLQWPNGVAPVPPKPPVSPMTPKK